MTYVYIYLIVGDLAHLATGTAFHWVGWSACLPPASLEELLFITAAMFPSEGPSGVEKALWQFNTKASPRLALNIHCENCMQPASYSRACSGFWWKCCGFVCYYQGKIRKQQRKSKGLAWTHLLANKWLCKFSWLSCHVKIVIIHTALRWGVHTGLCPDSAALPPPSLGEIT